jgi:hypothetical protein
MKFRTLCLATAVLASATGFAFAQSPNGTPGGAAPEATKAGAPNDTSKDKMAPAKAMKSGTTGAGMSNDDKTGKSNTPMSNGGVSPASPNAGEKQVK